MSSFFEDNKLALTFAGGLTLGAGITYLANKKTSSAKIEKPQVYYEVNLFLSLIYLYKFF